MVAKTILNNKRTAGDITHSWAITSSSREGVRWHNINEHRRHESGKREREDAFV